MASSGVEIAPSALPFGCVLRDRNHRDGYRESSKIKSTHGSFQRNIKNFVMDHINTRISKCDSSTTNENNVNINNNEGQMNNNNNGSSSWVSISKATNNLAKIRLTRNNHSNDINNNNSKGDKDELDVASMISPKRSRLLDQWAVRQAREMVSTLGNEVELLPIENRNNIAESARTSNSVSKECSSEIPNLGASSLVQIWENRLNKSNGSKPNTPMEKTCPSKDENVFGVVEEQRGLELGECLEGELSGNQESFSFSSFPDWESDRTGDQSRVCSADQSRWCSSESDRDRVSVADIIKKLTATSQTQSPPPSVADDNDHDGCGSSSVASSPRREFAHESSDQRAFPQLISLPRIRGRQAYNDLLIQLQNDRHGELKNLAERGTVSKFAQKGRIQALLRLKLLQRGVAAANVQSHQKSTSSEVNRQVQPRGSAIKQLREKFSTGVEQRNTVQAEVANTRSPPKEIVNNITQLEKSSTADQLIKDTSSQIVHGNGSHTIESTQKSVTQTIEKEHLSSNVIFQETCFEVKRDYCEDTSEATTSMTYSKLNEKDEINQHCDENSYDCALDEDESNQNYAENSYEDMVEENYYESNYDWISEISRPRSYWEERRQAWYREMLETGAPNEDIQVLLQRKTVSTFLSSDFRETMDRLMQSHRGTQTHLVNSEDVENDDEVLMAFLQERLQAGRTPQENGIERTEEEEEDGKEEEEEEEEDEHEEVQGGESLVSSLYHEVGDYCNQSSSRSYRENEPGDEFYRVASTSSTPYQSQCSFHDSRRNISPIYHRSVEMEIIYHMRGHMEQLYQEMTELRKSIKSCMDMQMQMQLQQSMNQGIQKVEKEEKRSHRKAGKKGNCCICNEMKIDSVLYRCGHMCACLKCANELQWNNGKCPICHAKIDDVVRVYVDV